MEKDVDYITLQNDDSVLVGAKREDQKAIFIRFEDKKTKTRFTGSIYSNGIAYFIEIAQDGKTKGLKGVSPKFTEVYRICDEKLDYFNNLEDYETGSIFS